MKNLILVGTGAIAAEVVAFMRGQNYMCEGEPLVLKGFIGDGDDLMDNHSHYGFNEPVLGDLMGYPIQSDDRFVIAINDPFIRHRVAMTLEERGAVFTNLIHPSCVIAADAEMGKGNIISPFSIIDCKVKMGAFNILTAYSAISHDCVVGNYNSFSSVIVCGYCKIGDNNSFFNRASILPSVNVGNGCVIQAGMVVDKNVPDNTTVFYKYKERIMAMPS